MVIVEPPISPFPSNKLPSNNSPPPRSRLTEWGFIGGFTVIRVPTVFWFEPSFHIQKVSPAFVVVAALSYRNTLVRATIVLYQETHFVFSLY